MLEALLADIRYDTYATSSYPDFLDFKAQNNVFTDMLAYSPSLNAINASIRRAR